MLSLKTSGYVFTKDLLNVSNVALAIKNQCIMELAVAFCNYLLLL